MSTIASGQSLPRQQAFTWLEAHQEKSICYTTHKSIRAQTSMHKQQFLSNVVSADEQ